MGICAVSRFYAEKKGNEWRPQKATKIKVKPYFSRFSLFFPSLRRQSTQNGDFSPLLLRFLRFRLSLPLFSLFWSFLTQPPFSCFFRQKKTALGSRLRRYFFLARKGALRQKATRTALPFCSLGVRPYSSPFDKRRGLAFVCADLRARACVCVREARTGAHTCACVASA